MNTVEWKWIALNPMTGGFTYLDFSSNLLKKYTADKHQYLAAVKEVQDFADKFAVDEGIGRSSIYLALVGFFKDGTKHIEYVETIEKCITNAMDAGMRKTFDAITAKATKRSLLPENRATTSPGKMLWFEFMKPSKISVDDLSERLNMSYIDIEAILTDNNPITPGLAAKLANTFDTTVTFWLNLQSDFDQTKGKLK